MKSYKYLSLSILTLSLAACGGGGGGSDTPSDEPAAAEVTSTSTPTVASSTPQGDVATSELIVERDFDLAQDAAISIVVDQDVGSNRYLSVCTEFENTETGYSINYESCILRTANSGPSNYQINVPNDINRLIAVSWAYIESLAPSYSLWDRETSGSVFMVK